MQSAINYTRDNEYEADRIGMKTLYDAGFDPHGAWPASSRSWRRSTAMPASRRSVADSPCRRPDQRSPCPGRELYGARALPPSLDFWLAKVRIQVRYGTETPQALLTYFDSRLQKGITPQDAAIYGKALALLQL